MFTTLLYNYPELTLVTLSFIYWVLCYGFAYKIAKTKYEFTTVYIFASVFLFMFICAISISRMNNPFYTKLEDLTIALNKKQISPENQMHFIKSPLIDIRKTLAENVNTDSEVLSVLKVDTDLTVQRAAYITLQKINKIDMMTKEAYKEVQFSFSTLVFLVLLISPLVFWLLTVINRANASIYIGSVFLGSLLFGFSFLVEKENREIYRAEVLAFKVANHTITTTEFKGVINSLTKNDINAFSVKSLSNEHLKMLHGKDPYLTIAEMKNRNLVPIKIISPKDF